MASEIDPISAVESVATAPVDVERIEAAVRDKNGGGSEQHFAASPAYDWQIASFERELQGIRGNLPDGDDAAYTVGVTHAVLKAIAERRIVAVG